MNLKNGKVFTSKFVRTGPSSYGKIIYRAAVSQNLRNTGLDSSRINLKLLHIISPHPLTQQPKLLNASSLSRIHYHTSTHRTR